MESREQSSSSVEAEQADWSLDLVYAPNGTLFPFIVHYFWPEFIDSSALYWEYGAICQSVARQVNPIPYIL